MFGDFQSPRLSPGEPQIQPIEASQLAEGNWRTFWRGLSGEEYPPAPWTAAVSGLRLEAAEPQLQPTFMCVAAAHAAAGGLSLAENTMIRASLDDDLGYWRELARAQARVIERLNERIPFATRPRSHDVLAAASPESQPTRVWKLNELAEWAALNSGRIVILPRAIAAARKSTFDDPAVVFAALEVLAGSFREVKARSAPRDKAKQELDALGIDIGGSVDPAHADDGYFVRWRGRRRFLDQHLKKGTSRDPRYSMRIYYTWDDELHMCVVGWLPGHLSNSLT